MAVVTTDQNQIRSALERMLQSKPTVQDVYTTYANREHLFTCHVLRRDGSLCGYVVPAEEIMENTRMAIDRVSAAYDIVTEIRRQLPRLIVDKLTVEVHSDPFHLRTLVRFKADKERHWDCELETVREGGRLIACQVPDTFIARLCMEV